MASHPGFPGAGGQVLIIGDVAGHLGALRRALAAHGVDPDRCTIPSNLVVVQVGDLVHRGPDSAAVVRLVDSFLRGAHGDRWIQLIGNHEQPYLFDRPSVIRRELDDTTAEIVRSWWADGRAHVATAVSPDWTALHLPRRMRAVHPAGDILVTHAGLTHGAWVNLGRPATAAEAADAVNAEARGPAIVALRAGSMISGTPDLSAGPLWAQAGAELLESWERTEDAPHLNQVHGHTTVRSWAQERWWPGAAAIINRGDLLADQLTKQELARMGTRLIWGIDPGHDREPTPDWEPLLLPVGSPQSAPPPEQTTHHRMHWHLPHRRRDSRQP